MIIKWYSIYNLLFMCSKLNNVLPQVLIGVDLNTMGVLKFEQMGKGKSHKTISNCP